MNVSMGLTIQYRIYSNCADKYYWRMYIGNTTCTGRSVYNTISEAWIAMANWLTSLGIEVPLVYIDDDSALRWSEPLALSLPPASPRRSDFPPAPRAAFFSEEDVDG